MISRMTDSGRLSRWMKRVDGNELVRWLVSLRSDARREQRK